LTYVVLGGVPEDGVLEEGVHGIRDELGVEGLLLCMFEERRVWGSR
jgi:hypothetical protein